MSLKTHKAAMRAGFEQEIITGASEEFALRGVENFSIRKLANKMGCAVGTLYLYFDNKEDLLRAVVEASFCKLLESLRAIPASHDPFELMQMAFRAYVEFGLNHPDHYRCAFALSAPAKNRKYQPHTAFDFLRDKVRAGVAAGLFRSKDAEIVSQNIWAAAHGLTSLLISRPNFPWAPKEKLIDAMSETLFTGLFISSPRNHRKNRQPRESA